ncbi:MAG: pyridoxamine 5'-phosphate oxidase family protein [Phycisphaeraceae bacterium]
MAQAELSQQQVIAAARRLIEQQIVGVLTTVDPDHRPHSRCMAGVPDEAQGLTTLLSLSARGARKLDQIDTNPNVCWLFSDEHDDEVVTILGTMQRLESPNMAEPVWQKLGDAAKQYAMNLLSEPENLWFEGLETRITQVEYMNPAKGLTHPVVYPVG